jgi:hypothetical protein
MAIPLTAKSFREAVGAALDDAFTEGWGVTAEWDIANNEMRVVKVERWDFDKHYGRAYVVKVHSARDELDAYMQAKKMMEQIK